jgi:hypothetical protein
MEVPAVLDTGARITCITSAIVHGLQLPPSHSTQQLSGAMGVGEADVHYVDLVLPLQAAGLHPLHKVLEVGIQHPSVQLLIGLDILCRGVFTLSFDGYFTFAL